MNGPIDSSRHNGAAASKNIVQFHGRNGLISYQVQRTCSDSNYSSSVNSVTCMTWECWGDFNLLSYCFCLPIANCTTCRNRGFLLRKTVHLLRLGQNSGWEVFFGDFKELERCSMSVWCTLEKTGRCSMSSEKYHETSCKALAPAKPAPTTRRFLLIFHPITHTTRSNKSLKIYTFHP